jgi:two-component system, NtrC family, sensor kinase
MVLNLTSIATEPLLTADFQRLVENVSDIYFVHDVSGSFTYLSPQFERVFGYAVSDCLGQDFLPLIHPDDLGAIDRMLQQLFQDRISHENLEIRFRHQQGHWVWILLSHSVLVEGAEVVAVQGVAKNISDRKATEDALRRSESRFQEIMQNIQGAVYRYITRIDGTDAFLYISPSWEKVYEQDPQEAIEDSRNAWKLVHPDDVESFQSAIETSAQSLEPFVFEHRVITPKGTQKWASFQVKPQKISTGDIIWDGITIDVTDRKTTELKLQSQTEKLEQALEELKHTQMRMIQSEKMSALGQLVAGVAHEINNPVNFIHGNLKYTDEYTQNLIELVNVYRDSDPKPSAKLQQLIDAIDLPYLLEDLPKMLSSMKMGADRIRDIVLSLRNFSRLDEAGLKAANLHEGLDNTLLILQHRLKSQDYRPEIHIVKTYGVFADFECYAGQLNQVFMNILSNAIDALEESWQKGSRLCPKITIVTEEMANAVVIRISDTGIGIPHQHLSQLFDPFYTTKPVGTGTGMGLSISYQIVVDRHRGRLECESIPDEGTTFLIYLPQRHRSISIDVSEASA